MASPQSQPSLPRRLAWFVALWLAGTGTVAIVAFVLRLWLKPG
jgi:hypothetical protein